MFYFNVTWNVVQHLRHSNEFRPRRGSKGILFIRMPFAVYLWSLELSRPIAPGQLSPQNPIFLFTVPGTIPANGLSNIHLRKF